MKHHGFLIAAPQSGSGKTTVSLAIMAALVRRGITVAPFKCGPDFIDPGYHRAVTGQPSINLDGWMCGEEFVMESFQTRLESLTGQTIAVIEGAMGLFDGLGASSKDGSSAQIATITGAPVVLVVNARGMAASAAALVKGFAGFDAKVEIAGVIFNNVGSASHAALLKEVLAKHCPDIICFGCILRDELLVIPSRHLGLVTAEDNPLSQDFIARLAEVAEQSLDLSLLSRLQIAQGPSFVTSNPATAPTVRIAVARDSAFCFMYEDNLRLLRNAGAELVFFSPLQDTCLPENIHGIYLPGGYPELYAQELHNNSAIKNALRDAISQDMPVYAECGGFIFLTEGMAADDDSPSSEFVGIFPVRCRMLKRRKALGYRQVELLDDALSGTKGSIARGHEFHYSEISPMPEDIKRLYQVSRHGVLLETEGFRVRNCMASYIHIHFGSNSGYAPAFTASCRRFLEGSKS